MKRGKGICDSHWQWKWQQVWALGKCPASDPSQCREAVEQMQSSPFVQDGGGWLMGPSSCASLVAVQCCVSSLCGMRALPKDMASGSSQEPCWYSLYLPASSPAGPFTISKTGRKSFEAEDFDSDISKATAISGALCSTKSKLGRGAAKPARYSSPI